MSSSEKLAGVTLEKLENARFVRPYTMRFKLGGKDRRWYVVWTVVVVVVAAAAALRLKTLHIL